MQYRDIKTIYMMGIGGIAMGTLATMLREKEYHVVGSDQNLYPPMSTHLESLQIPLYQGYSAENLRKSTPDMVIIGNVIRRDNPEAQFVLDHGLPYLSMPQAIAHFFLSEQKSMVVAGTHGKSTTSSLLAWVLAHGGMDPSAFIGAFVKNWQQSYRLGSGPYMAIEGDEYDTAFFDKGPKFLHYRPLVGILTSIEFDHADIFADFQAVFQAFRSFVHQVPEHGTLIVNADDSHCMALGRECKGKVLTYGWAEHADWRILDVTHGRGEVRFAYRMPEPDESSPLPSWQGSRRIMLSRLPGKHNAANTISVMAAAHSAGLSMEQFQEALLAFEGVKRRQDVVGECNGVMVMDDFAHHPTAVLETIQALRLFYPDRRLIAAFEPRTNSSRRSVFQEAYAGAFDEADLVCIKHPPGLDTIPEAERLDTERLAGDIRRRGKETHCFEATDRLLHFLVERTAGGDLVVCMSNGSFDGLPQRLLHALEQRWETRPGIWPRT